MTDIREKRIKLRFPVEHDGVEVREVAIRRPRTRDVRQIEVIAAASNTDKVSETIAILGVLTGLSPEALEDMDFEDFTKLSETIAGFFPQATASENGEA